MDDKENEETLLVETATELVNALDVVTEPVVEGLLNRGEMATLSAVNKIGKSLWALLMAMAVATGRAFLNKWQTKPGTVLYLNGEIVRPEKKKRILSLAEAMGGDVTQGSQLIMHHGRLQLNNPKHFAKLRRTVEKIKPALLVVDPLSAFHSGQEDSASDMNPLMHNLHELGIKLNCAILIVTHQGKATEGSPNQYVGHRARGSSAIGDTSDSNWSLRPSGGAYVFSANFRSAEPITELRLKRNGLIWSLDEGSTSASNSPSHEDSIVGYVTANAGNTKTAAVVAYAEAALKIDRSRTEKLLTALVTSGRLIRPEKGIYAVPPHPQPLRGMGSRVDQEPEVVHAKRLGDFKVKF